MIFGKDNSNQRNIRRFPDTSAIIEFQGPKETILIANQFVPSANQIRLTTPTSVGVRGMGTKIGAGLSGENRPHFIGTSTTTT